MDYELGPKQSRWSLLATPGPILALLGIVILCVAIYYFRASSPGGDVDSIIQAQSQTGARLKSMVAMVIGVLVSMAGALWSLMTFSRGR